MVKFELSEQIKRKILCTFFNYRDSAFAEDKPYNYLDFKSLYDTFKRETIFSPYDYNDIIWNIDMESFNEIDDYMVTLYITRDRDYYFSFINSGASNPITMMFYKDGVLRD